MDAEVHLDKLRVCILVQFDASTNMEEQSTGQRLVR